MGETYDLEEWLLEYAARIVRLVEKCGMTLRGRARRTSNIEHRTLLGRGGEGERAAGAIPRCPDFGIRDSRI